MMIWWLCAVLSRLDIDWYVTAQSLDSILNITDMVPAFQNSLCPLLTSS